MNLLSRSIALLVFTVLINSEFVLASPQKILLAEDDPAVRFEWTSRLTAAGYEVDWVATGEDALAKFRANPKAYLAVVTDNSMPNPIGLHQDDDDGLRLTEAIRQIDKEIPIYMETTSKSSALFIKLATRAGATRVVGKIDHNLVIQELRRDSFIFDMKRLEAVRTEYKALKEKLKGTQKPGWFAGTYTDNNLLEASKGKLDLNKASPEVRRDLETFRTLFSEVFRTVKEIEPNLERRNVAWAFETSHSSLEALDKLGIKIGPYFAARFPENEAKHASSLLRAISVCEGSTEAVAIP